MKKQFQITINIVAALIVVQANIFLAGCTSTSRSDNENDCEYAKSRHAEMQESVRLYYALGQTSVVEIAVAERRLRKAKEDYKAACGESAPDEGLLNRSDVEKK